MYKFYFILNISWELCIIEERIGGLMIFEEGFIICNEQMKESIMKSIESGFRNYIFLSENQLKEKVFFQVKLKAIPFLMRKYGFTYSLAKEYCHAITLIEDKNYNDIHLDGIVSIFHELKKQGLLKFDPLFLVRLKQYLVTFINPDQSLEYKHLKEIISTHTKVIEVNHVKDTIKPEVYQFSTILEESLAVMNRIKDLLSEGVSLNQIFIISADESYYFLFERLSRSYQIPMNFPAKPNFLSSIEANEFLIACKSCQTFNEVLLGIKNNVEFYNSMIRLLNQYGLQKEKPFEQIEFISSIFKEMSFPKRTYAQAVHFGNVKQLFTQENYVFYVGFNLGRAPFIRREDGFLNDRHLHLLSCSTSSEINELEKGKLIDFITSTPNLWISYKEHSGKDECLPSFLIRELGLNVVLKEASFGYAKTEDILRLSVAYDAYLKYGTKSNELQMYGLQGIEYQTFNHKYKNISPSILEEKFKEKPLKMAYSNIKLFYACPFSYYADRILGLNEFKSQMAARLGTFAHAVLEDSYNEDFIFNESVKMRTIENRMDAKDEFFFNKMKELLRQLITFNRQHERESKLFEVEREAHIVVELENCIFEGYIDKLLYTIDNDEVYAAIIDYKTGKDIISLDNIVDGFHLQLPAYMYLLSKYKKFYGKNIHIIGIYLQKVNLIAIDNTKDSYLQMEKSFYLQGYSIADPSLLVLLDPSYANSTYIKSLGLSKTTNSFKAYSKVYQAKDQAEMTQLVEDLIVKARDEILRGEFPIAPKMIDGKNESCTFCKYKDICFCDYSDIVELEKKPFNKEQ